MDFKTLNKMFQFFFKIPQFQNWQEIMTALAKGQKPSRVILKSGLKIEAPEDVSILRAIKRIFFKKMYLPSPLDIKRNDVVVDIGANIGVFTAFAATRTENMVYAFEPFPNTFKFLSTNIHANNFHHVHAYAMAVCDKVGTQKFFLNKKMSTGHSLSDYFTHNDSENYIEVPTTSLPQIMDDNSLEKIDFLKMDCEGAEGSIFQSIPQHYLKKIKKIAMEFHDHASPLTHSEIEKLLLDAGYTTSINWNKKKSTGYLYAYQD